ncbi:MAG: metallophosphoesterase [Chitinophagales bacterium]
MKYSTFYLLFLAYFLQMQNMFSASVSRGPYLNAATQHSVHIRWRTNTATNSVVQFGLIDGTLNQTTTDAALVTEHDVLITGLNPDTKYFYSIGASLPTVETYYAGSKYFFSTLPVKGAERLTRIWAIGDCGNNSSNQLNVRNSYMQYMGTNHTDIMMLLGDNAYDNGSDAQYQESFFPQYQDSLLRNVVLWPAPGNHDYDNNSARQNDHNVPYYNIFTLPENGEAGGVASGTERYYSYDYANIHFLSLDSYGKDSGRYFIYDTSGPQVEWIKRDLAANTQKWTIAYMHHPPYTSGSHSSENEPDLRMIRERFIRILERYGVDLLLCGHSHVYERSYFLNGYYSNYLSFDLNRYTKTTSSGKYDASANSCPYIKNQDKEPGTVYAVVGSAGKVGPGTLGTLINLLTWPQKCMVHSDREIGGGMAITVNGNRLDAEWVCSDGVIRDRFTMMKDVNKKTIYTIPQGDSVLLSPSWQGNYSWPGGITTSNFNFVGNSPNTDTVVVKDNFTCIKDTFIIKKSNVTGVKHNNANEELIKVYPNPSSTGNFKIDFTSNDNKPSSIKVFDLSGKLIFKEDILIKTGETQYELKLNNIPSGIYILNIDEHVVTIQK